MADQKTYVAIGDVHGCSKSLKALLDTLEEQGVLEDRTIVFIGDYVDRGPDSKGVVDLLMELSKDHECVFLRGNHEQMLLNAHQKQSVSGWMINGGDSTLKSYGDDLTFDSMPGDHVHFYQQTKIYFDTPDYFFVHAGVAPDMTIEESIADPHMDEYFLWRRDHLNATTNSWEKTVVFGHTPMQEPLNKNKMLGIDTGCVYPELNFGKLTAVLLPETEFIQQDCLDK